MEFLAAGPGAGRGDLVSEDGGAPAGNERAEIHKD